MKWTGLEGIENAAVRTPFGDPSDKVIVGRIDGRRVCFLPRHGVGHRLLPHEINHRANIWALRSLSVRWLISVTAVGSLREEMAPRDIVVPDQLIDRTGTGAKHTFFGNGIAAHVGFADPYCGDLRGLLLDGRASAGSQRARRRNLSLHEWTGVFHPRGGGHAPDDRRGHHRHDQRARKPGFAARRRFPRPRWRW